MSNGESVMMDKIRLLAQNTSSELHDELYPKNLGEKIRVRAPEIRLTVIAKYEGMGIVLQKLGADISKLEAMIEEEVDKTSASGY